MKIALIGSDEGTLALALLLARQHSVTLLTSSEAQADRINDGAPLLTEPFAIDFQNTHRGLLHLKATTSKLLALSGAVITIIGEADGRPDASKSDNREHHNALLADHIIHEALPLNPGSWFILQGLLPLGETLLLRKRHHTPNIIRAPFLGHPLHALQSILHSERIVVGSCTALGHTYAQLIRLLLGNPDTPIQLTGSHEAEAIGLLHDSSQHHTPTQKLKRVIEFALLNGLATRDLIEGLSLHTALPELMPTAAPSPMRGTRLRPVQP